MRIYRVYVADMFSKIPLGYFDVRAWTKGSAKRKIFKKVCSEDDSYLVTASRKERQSK